MNSYNDVNGILRAELPRRFSKGLANKGNFDNYEKPGKYI